MRGVIMVLRCFRLAKAFAFARTIGPIRGTFQVTEPKWKLGDHALQIMRMVEYRQER